MVISPNDRIARVATGAPLGGVIGFECDIHARPVGRRTHFIIAGWFGFVFALGSLLGCAAPGKRMDSGKTRGDLLFPGGKYTHQVQLRIPEAPDPSKRSFDFRGIVAISPEVIRIAVLSPFGTTLFRMTENRASGELKVENFVSELKTSEARVREYYADLRKLLLAHVHESEAGGDEVHAVSRDSAGRPVRLEANGGSPPTRYRLDAWDERGVPLNVKVEGAHFTVTIEVTSYEI